MKKIMFIFLLASGILALTACGTVEEEPKDAAYSYEQITAEKAKALIDNETGYTILDASTQDEYDAGHIEGAILIPEYDSEKQAPDKLPDKEQLILVYCRSGRRSKIAAEALAELGYTNVKEFGGIIDLPYGIVQ